MPPLPLILASSSRYRRAQMASLGLPVQCLAPDIDETALIGESPDALAVRLARAKAFAVAARTEGLIIGSDQVACVNGVILGKPGSDAAQCQQLALCSGQRVVFYTALAVLDSRSGEILEHLDLTCCQVRELDADSIARYVASEPAHDCAGGFKVEARGILLFERIDSGDPSALVGLPLIGLGRLLRQFEWQLP